MLPRARRLSPSRWQRLLNTTQDPDSRVSKLTHKQEAHCQDCVFRSNESGLSLIVFSHPESANSSAGSGSTRWRPVPASYDRPKMGSRSIPTRQRAGIGFHPGGSRKEQPRYLRIDPGWP